jgi:bis(5'-nucleosyl)-tetraphosphatase (symmetrical)
MALYLIGDIQGCNAAFTKLLQQLVFSPSRDTLYVLGDMVNRGEDSAGVLRQLMRFGASAQCVLGNHDLHLLAVSQGLRVAHPSDTLDGVLQAPDASAMLDWLRHQDLAMHAHGWLMVHAGVLPQWSSAQTLLLAQEVQAVLRGEQWTDFLAQMYGNTPNAWRNDLQGADRLRVVVNALTRLRFCNAEGEMEFASKEGAGFAPAGYLPWFDTPARHSANERIAFGHWSTLGLLQRPSAAPHLLGLDTGCVWGGALTAAELASTDGAVLRMVQVRGQAH